MTIRLLVSLKVLGAVAAGVLVTAVTLCSHAHAQQAAIPGSSGLRQQRPRAAPESMTPPTGSISSDPFTAERATAVATAKALRFAMDDDPRSSVIGKLDELRKQLGNAKAVEQKGQIKTSVRKALSEYFDLDLQQRKAELDRLTKRSDDMVALLTKREAAKDQIVDLQLTAFQYEAEGLGLFSERRTGPRLKGPAAGGGMYGASGGAGGYADMADGTSGMEEGVDPITAALSRVYWQARLRLQGTASPEDEAKVTTELRAALREHFDRDLESRRKELDEIKKGLVDMSDCLKRRADAKDEIVDLQLQMVVNEAEGLGFFSGSDASNNLPGVTFGGFGGWSKPSPLFGTGMKEPSRTGSAAKQPQGREPASVASEP